MFGCEELHRLCCDQLRQAVASTTPGTTEMRAPLVMFTTVAFFSFPTKLRKAVVTRKVPLDVDLLHRFEQSYSQQTNLSGYPSK